MRYSDLESFEVRDLVLGLKAYVCSDDKVYREDDPRYRLLRLFLFNRRPAPSELRPLLSSHDYKEIGGPLLKRDKIALVVVQSLAWRAFTVKDDPQRQEVFDVLAEAGIAFSFDPIYGDSHPKTAEELGDFFATDHPVCAESQAAIRKCIEPLIERWRGRVTDKGSSTFFGILLRHAGPAGADRIFQEWPRMHEEERYDILKRLADVEKPGRASRRAAVEALLDPSHDVRQAACEALSRHGAPLGDIDDSARDEEIRKAQPALREWAEKTRS